jgi:phosphoribosylanthranilate isomerase
MKIKICGLTSVAEAAYLNEVDADFAGMVLFFPKSKRNIDISRAKEIIAALKPSIRKVAVVVSPKPEQVQEIAAAGFDYIQIHGTLSEELLAQAELPVIRAFNVSNMQEMETLKGHKQIAGFLFDAVTPGSGQVFDWSTVPKVAVKDQLLILAGGLKQDNVKAAIEAVHPDCVDVSSGVENDSGVGKSREKILAFAAAARA